MWAAALSRVVSRPVLSTTTSMPSSRQGNCSGCGSINMVTGEEPTIMVSCSTETGRGKGPWTESRASKRASASGSPRSFTAATSTSWGDLRAARRKARPVRPNPLIATLTAMLASPLSQGHHVAPLCPWSHRDGTSGRDKGPRSAPLDERNRMERTYVTTNGAAPGDLCPYPPGNGHGTLESCSQSASMVAVGRAP